jgi:hypothetical protein
MVRLVLLSQPTSAVKKLNAPLRPAAARRHPATHPHLRSLPLLSFPFLLRTKIRPPRSLQVTDQEHW